MWPEHRSTGAGSAAVRAALSAAEEMGEHYVIVLGHPTYYPRFGFARASTHGIGASIDVPDEAQVSAEATALTVASRTGTIAG